MDGVSPAVARRRLALELRRLRAQAGKTIYDAAEHLECSAGKISRIEMGLVGARIQDVREILDLYDVSEQARDQLLDLVRQSRRRAWWQDFADILPPDSTKLYGLEDGAAVIDEHSTVLVPGLLQTRDYAAALIGSAQHEDPDVVQRRVELRMRRQQLLTRADPPAVTMLLDEAVIAAEVGSRTVMAGQLRHLADVANRPGVAVRILPTGCGVHPAAGVSFTTFGFVHPSDPKIVYLEQLTRNTFIEESDEVHVYENAFAQAARLAVSKKESRAMILRRAKELAA